MITVKEFRKRTRGVSKYDLFYNGEWITGREISKYDNYLITDFYFDSEYNGNIICTLDIIEVD